MELEVFGGGGQIFDPHMYAQTVITGCALRGSA